MDILIKRSLEKDLREAVATVAGVLAFALLTFAAAAVKIPLPFSPVPITLQTLVVLLAGAFLGAAAGSLSQLMYLAFGLTGFSVFAGSGAGILYLSGPTGGYLVGFVLAALVSGAAARSAKSSAALFLGFLLASLIILACGTLWLASVTRISFTGALVTGFLPFIPGDVLKALAAAALFRRFKSSGRK